MNITSSKKRIETRFAAIKSEGEAGLTLDEVEAFVKTARQAEVPGETVVLVTGGFLFAAGTPTMSVRADVEVSA